MKTAVVGSRSLEIKSLRPYIPAATTEIVSGGAKGIDTFAKKFAKKWITNTLSFCLITKNAVKLHP